MNWIQFVSDYRKKHDVSLSDAMKACKPLWKKMKKGGPVKGGALEFSEYQPDNTTVPPMKGGEDEQVEGEQLPVLPTAHVKGGSATADEQLPVLPTTPAVKGGKKSSKSRKNKSRKSRKTRRR